MKKYLLLVLALIASTAAFAGGNELSYFKIQELPTLAAGSVASGDFVPVFDASAGKVKKIDATALPFTGAYNGTVGATTPASGSFTTLTVSGTTTNTGNSTTTGTVTRNRTPAADSATTNQTDKVALTAPVDTTGTNTHQAFDVALTVSNATGGTNTVNGYTFDNYTGDAQVNVNALKIGTSDGLGTAYGINIGSGWDAGIITTSKVINSYAAGADSGTTNNSSAINLTFPVDTTGTNTHNLLDMALTAANATGGTNQVNGLKFENYTGDAQVNVSAINIGTSDALGTANAIQIGAGWDLGISDASGITSTGAITGASVVPTALVGPPPTAGGSSITLTAAKAGQVVKLDTAAGTTATLPAATGTGNHYLFVVSVAATSNAHKILAASSSDNITGIMIGQNANTNKSFQCATSSGYHSIQMPFAGTQPSGGLQGDSFEFIDVGTNLWFVRGNYSAGTTPTTPCSTATS